MSTGSFLRWKAVQRPDETSLFFTRGRASPPKPPRLLPWQKDEIVDSCRLNKLLSAVFTSRHPRGVLFLAGDVPSTASILSSSADSLDRSLASTRNACK